MGLNSNNYIGHTLDWTPFTTKEDLPIGSPIAFRSETGELHFGRVRKISNGVMLLIDGHFGFDMEHVTKNGHWASLDFVFQDVD